ASTPGVPKTPPRALFGKRGAALRIEPGVESSEPRAGGPEPRAWRRNPGRRLGTRGVGWSASPGDLGDLLLELAVRGGAALGELQRLAQTQAGVGERQVPLGVGGLAPQGVAALDELHLD